LLTNQTLKNVRNWKNERAKKNFEENIIRVENEQVLHIKTELTLYLIGEKSFVPFFFFCPYSFTPCSAFSCQVKVDNFMSIQVHAK